MIITEVKRSRRQKGSEMSAIVVKDACVAAYGEDIFYNVNMCVEVGTCHGLIGKDNEGKSSLLYAMLGLNRLTAGTITLFDTIRPQQRKQYKSRIGYLPDELLCFGQMTGAQLLDKTMQIRGIRDWVDYAEQLIDYFQVNPAMYLEDMTDDMNKCIYIISTILSEPELLILDEPFNFLQKDSRERLKLWLQSYVKDKKTVLLVSDNYEELRGLCDVITVMKNRTVAASGLRAETIREFKLITAENMDFKSLPEVCRVVECDARRCKIAYNGEVSKLKEVISHIKCDNFTIEDVTIDDILFQKYDWIEELHW